MFLLIQAVRSLLSYTAQRRATAEWNKAKERVDAADARVKLAAKGTLTDQVVAKVALEAAETAFLEADERYDVALDKRTAVKSPTSRIPTYLAGKIDAATAAVLVYPYVPAVVAWVKSLV